MNENISRTEAHKVFANLYRKKRDPDHQAKVDEIITRSNDVFIRIDLIKKLDEEYERNQRNQLKEERKSSGGGGSASNNVGKDTEKNISVPKRQAIQKPKPKEEEEDQVGFFGRLLGTSSGVTKFAKESRAIELGLFGRNPTISPNVEKIFKGLSEDEIIGTAQALKYCEQNGWKVWHPIEYNIVLNFGRFFNAFISLDSLFKDEISPEVFLGRTTKMIMYYIRILNHPETRDVILDKVPNLVKREPKLTSKLDFILRGLNYTLTLESRRPTLKDAIIAFHVVMHKRVPTWEEVTKKMQVAPLDETKFLAPTEILKQVEMAVAKLTSDINMKLDILNETKSIKNEFFKFKENGNINLSFIDSIIDDYVAHYYPESNQSDLIKSNIRQTPPKLLQTLCRDIQTLYLPIFEGYIKVDADGVKDVLVFQPGLFLPEIEKINNIIRSFDAFNRKFQSFSYTFQKYGEDLSKGTTDQIESQLVKLMSDSADFFGKFAKKLTVIVENHKMAKDHEKDGTINDKILANKDKVIEEVKIMQRFIPYGDARLVAQNRLNDVPVKDMLKELTMMLYNYAVLFRDPTIIELLTSTKKSETEIEKLRAEYERLTGTEFTPNRES
ncbi:MAG: hypothetical protein KDK36_11440 [Leptospiraceae bacterium]|nr:hypothetical protein [Leptospiraceae bacterium]